MRIKITNRKYIGEDDPAFIVAEIGQNHNGDVNNAKKLIDLAALAGVDAVKFCKRHIPSELTKEAYNRPYEGPQSFGKTYGEHREYLELSRKQHKELAVYAKRKGLIYFASACDRQSVDDMLSIGVPLLKVASRDLTNLPLIEYMAKTKLPIVLSTGMASMQDIDEAVNLIRAYHDKVVVINCTSEYPCEYEHVNLRKIIALRVRYDCVGGFSDHTIGIAMVTASIPFGAKYIEKHFTLHRHMKGTDHAGSLEFEGLRRVVRDIRNTEKAMGNGSITQGEFIEATKKKLARSLVSACRIQKGRKVLENHLCLKSPGGGILWRDRSVVVGKTAVRNIAQNVTLKKEWFK